MIEKKKLLYEKGHYFLLFLSVFADLSLFSFILVVPFTFLISVLNPSVAQGIFFLVIIAMCMAVMFGIFAKMIDKSNIKFIDGEIDKDICKNCLVLQFILIIPAVLYWLYVFALLVGSLLPIK